MTGKDIETITSLVKEVLDSNRFIIQQNESMRQYLGQREGTIEHFLINPDSIGASGFLYRTDELSEALAPKRKG